MKPKDTIRGPRPKAAAPRFAASLLLMVALVGCGGGGGTPPVTENPVPTLTSISPTSATVGGLAFTLTVNGSNFISTSVVRWNASDRTTTFVSAAQLTASIPATDIAAAGTVQVTVFNPSPGGGTSTGLTFTIENPAPTLTSLSPTSALASGPAFTLTVNGSNFISTSVVRWNAFDCTTTFVSAAQLTASIPASDIAAAGTAEVTVFNPTPGGGTSNPLTFTIAAAQPLAITTTQLPASAGGKSYDVTLAGQGGAPPVTWSLTAGSLPPSLTLDSPSGRIAGTVTPVGSSTTKNFTVQATDSSLPARQASKALSILVRAGGLGSNNVCSPGTTVGTTAISNGRVRASISPYGDVDVYSFHGTAGAQVTIEIFAQRLDLDGDASTRDSWLDSVVQFLDGSCSQLTFNDDINPGIIQDSLIENYTLPATGTYFILVRDFRGDGRPDLIYELSLSGAN